MNRTRMSETQWVQFPAHSFKRKRAGLACVFCHSKKIRCDIQAQRDRDVDSCTNCSSSGRICSIRQSKRNKSCQTGGNQGLQPPTPPADNTNYSRTKRPPPGTRNSGTNYDVVNSSQVNNFQNDKPSPHDQAHRTRSRSKEATNLNEFQWPDPNNDTGFPISRVNDGNQAQTRHNNDILNESVENWTLPSREQSEAGILRQNTLPTGPFQFGDISSNEANSLQDSMTKSQSIDFNQEDLRQSFTETYFEYCYPWCPVLDRTTILEELAASPLLDEALAISGSHIRPPLIPHPGPARYYDRARKMFYNDEEEDLVKSLKAVLLFYWWAPRSTITVHKHSSWWWTSVVIKHAQQAGFHRESLLDQSKPTRYRCFKRRVWWTAFARERLTAICQGKPCMIDPTDCNIPEPSIEDFPEVENKSKAEVFIYWVRLCSIIGRIANELSRATKSSSSDSRPFPESLGRDLIQWVRSLPPHLQLPIGSRHTANFQLDVHQLHLPYLAVIIILHLTRSSQPMPQALPPATLAASCIARILKDILLRSATRYLMPITCWYSAIAFTTLIQASRTENLREAAMANAETLMLAIKELSKMWATGKVFEVQCRRLLENSKPLTPEDFPGAHLGNDRSIRALNSELEVLQSGIDWLDYFPFVTSQTSQVSEKLLAPQSIEDFFWDETSLVHCDDLLQGLDGWACPDYFV